MMEAVQFVVGWLLFGFGFAAANDLMERIRLRRLQRRIIKLLRDEAAKGEQP